MIRALATTAFVGVACILSPVGAAAAIHSGGITWNEPANPPTIGPPLRPAIEESPYDHNVEVVYDDVAGSFTMTTELYDPAHWGESHAAVEFAATATCNKEARSQRELVEAGEELGREGLSGQWLAEPEDAEEINGVTRIVRRLASVSGHVNLAGIGGTVEGTGTFNGQVFTISFQSPYFAGQQWHCVTLIDRGQVFTFPLNNYPAPPRPLAIKVRRATHLQVRAMEAAANRHHTGDFNSAHHHFLSDRTTPNGWAAASWSIFPHNAQPETIVFHYASGHWHVVTWGSSVCGPGTRVPHSICQAFGL